ncbi:MAG: hypothetical protein CM1200mP40_25230 [Gammaproteobacteria bacterium]|nr:MAG: hypothetical protein CM1200mP40_25230 [Gammaproteobacteria bacterium]
MQYWLDESTPGVVIVFLDGESPYGDSYQMNSAVPGPYADANFNELFPYLAKYFLSMIFQAIASLLVAQPVAGFPWRYKSCIPVTLMVPTRLARIRQVFGLSTSEYL